MPWSKSENKCEDIKKARHLLRESSKNLEDKLEEQRKLIREYQKPSIIVLMN